MKNLDIKKRKEIILQMSLCLVNAGQHIFEQNGIGSYFYVVKEGIVSLYIDDKLIKSLHTGDSFGEIALLHGVTRSGTIVAGSDCSLWVLDRLTFRKVKENISRSIFEGNKKFILSVPLLGAYFIKKIWIMIRKLFYAPI
jgi:cAMP-dependent protein kinase regulator